MELEEKWKDIKDYPNYGISNYGRVLSKERRSTCSYNATRLTKERILKQSKDKKGYFEVTLFKNGKHTKKVHKLVADSFLDNPNNFNCINHIDGNKENNNVDNLEHCTAKHNIKESYRLGLQKPSDKQKEAVSNYCKKNKVKTLIQLDNYNNFIKEWESAVEAERTTGIDRKNISQCVTKRNKTAGGYKWITKEQYEANCYKIGE